MGTANDYITNTTQTQVDQKYVWYTVKAEQYFHISDTI